MLLAGDALALWPFFARAWVNGERRLRRCRSGTEASLGILRRPVGGVGVLTKYMSMSALVALAILIVQLARRRRMSGLEAGLLLILASLVIVVQQRLHPNFAGAMDLSMGRKATMSYRDAFGLHSKNLHIFRAPPYDESLEVERRASSGQPYDPGPPYELSSVLAPVSARSWR